MKNTLHRIILGTVLVSGCWTVAGESAGRRLGDAAFYAGDYTNAISCYESVMAEALRNDRLEVWADCALNLGAAYLRSGELAKAKALLAEFRRRCPLRSTGTLEGDLLAAEGKTEAAENMLKDMRTTDPVMEDARLFSLGMLYMDTGRPAEAYDLFIRIAGRIGEQWHGVETGALRDAMLAGQAVEVCRIAGRLTIRPDSPWRRYAVREAVYALIQLDRIGEAQEILKNLPADWRDTDVELLTYLADAKSGEIAGFKRNFTAFVEKLPQTPHARLLELFSVAAKVAGEKGDHRFAADLLGKAMDFAGEAELKQELHRQLLVRLLAFAPDQAVEAAQSYCRSYPQADDRLPVVFNTAWSLYRGEYYLQALQLYVFLMDNTAGSKGEVAAMRLEAAANAVVCAEKLKDFASLEKFTRLLINESDKGNWWQCRYAAFLETNNRLEDALNELRNAYSAAVAAKRTGEAEKTAYLILEFAIRRDQPVLIREFALMLNNSQTAEYAARAKLELGQLMANAMLYRQARRYFQEAAALPVAEYAVPAAFNAVLMAYKDNGFPAADTAAEFMAFAVRYPEYEKSPEALFVAVELFELADMKDKAAEAAGILREKYPVHPAFAVLVLREAGRSRENSGSNEALIADLLKVERNFTGTAYAREAALFRAVFIDRAGKADEALRILSSLHEVQDKFLAMESFIRSGEILFRQGKLTEAKAAFLQAAAIEPGTLQSDIAAVRAGDCELAGKAPIDPAVLTECIARFARLANSSKFMQIRLEAFYKYGVALEHAGKPAEARSCYERAVYTAVDMRSQHIYPDEIWCLRSCDAALRLMVDSGMEGAFQRGMRLIDQLASVLQNNEPLTVMRENYRRQFTQK